MAGLVDTAVGPAARAGHDTVAIPFRGDAAELVAMYGIAEAGTSAWHRSRAHTLLCEAKNQPVAALTDAWWRLAARHLATAELLESQG